MYWLVHTLVLLIFLLHTPLFVDCLQQLLPHWNIRRLTSRTSSTLLILCVIIFFFFGLGMHLFVFVPLVPNVSMHFLKLTLHCLFAYWVWINMAVNYLHVVLSKPGVFRCGNVLNPHENSPIQRENINSHYCTICQSNIPYKDHHCPFTGNCIGLENYLHFFYLWLTLC